MPDVVFLPNRASDQTSPLGRYQRFRKCAKTGRINMWSCKATAKRGDLYLFWFGAPELAVTAIGVNAGDVDKYDVGDVDYSTTGFAFESSYYSVIWLKAPIGVDQIRANVVLASWWAGSPFRGKPKTMLQNPKAASALLSLIVAANPASKPVIDPYLKPIDEDAAPAPKLSKKSKEKLGRLFDELRGAERKRLIQLVHRATRDRRLRPVVLAEWGHTCAACGQVLMDGDEVSECEVAHIDEVHLAGADASDNVFPLCRRHHWAFDRLLWAVHPKKLTMVVRKDLRKASLLSSLHGKKLRVPTSVKGAHQVLSRKALTLRWERFIAGSARSSRSTR